MLLFKQDKPDQHGNSCRSKLASKYSLTLCSYLSSQQIQDAADQGIMFVGFIQEPAGLRPHVLRRGEPEEPSLSLHSSPSSLHGSGLTPSPSPLEEPELGDESGAENEGKTGGGEALREDVKASEGGDGGDDLSVEKSGSGETQQGDTLTHNNNDKAKIPDTTEKPSRLALTKSGGWIVFILWAN